MIEKQIEEKQEEIEHYKGVLKRYAQEQRGSGRWMNMGLQHLEELENQLKELQQKQQDTI